MVHRFPVECCWTTNDDVVRSKVFPHNFRFSTKGPLRSASACSTRMTMTNAGSRTVAHPLFIIQMTGLPRLSLLMSPEDAKAPYMT